MSQRSAGVLLIAAAVPAVACERAPTLTALNPVEGQPRDVVMIEGARLASAQVVWDAGTATERVVPAGFPGASMFSVPPGASVGPHSVALQDSAGRSSTKIFTVLMLPPGVSAFAPKPRIDYVTIVAATFNAGNVATVLYVQGANVDIGATVSIRDDAASAYDDAATFSHKALLNERYDVPDSEFDIPIHAYTSTIALGGSRPVGGKIWLKVKNLDGVESEPFEYDLPSSADKMDSDGDGLPDVWEINGYHVDGGDVDLPILGADPLRRDLFVELDVMEGVRNGPDSDVWGAVKNMFEAAPIINVNVARGINLVLDVSGTPCLSGSGTSACSFNTTVFDTGSPAPSPSPVDPFTTGIVNFSQLKAKNFDDTKRGAVYHYGIWGKQLDSGDAGISDFADDFLITLDFDMAPVYTTRSRAEALAHELGHDLRQLHGGDAHRPRRKPNYSSVMSPLWELRTEGTDLWRISNVTCLPFYYATPGATESYGAVPMPLNAIVDYSAGMAKVLVKPPPASPAAVLCGSSVAWGAVDGNPRITEDFANWVHLKFDGPVLNGWPMRSDGILP